MRQSSRVMIAVFATAVLGSGGALTAAGAPPGPATNVVLVHGAFADGSSWSKVIPLLLAKGLKVTAVGNPLTSFADDVAATRRAIAAQDGPTVLVGHSYGGVVITEAGNDPKVASLVYVAAFAPDMNEALGGLLQRFPDLGLGKALVPDAEGFLYIDPAQYPVVFANGLPLKQAAAFATEQKPIAGSALGEALTTPPAWKTIPSWYVVGTEDRAINPELERFMAKRMGAKVTELKSGHLVFIARAPEVARIIEDAAK